VLIITITGRKAGGNKFWYEKRYEHKTISVLHRQLGLKIY